MRDLQRVGHVDHRASQTYQGPVAGSGAWIQHAAGSGLLCWHTTATIASAVSAFGSPLHPFPPPLLHSFPAILKWCGACRMPSACLRPCAANQQRHQNLRLRVTEHSVMVVAQYYTRISIKRLAELLDLPPAEVHSCGGGDLRGGKCAAAVGLVSPAEHVVVAKQTGLSKQPSVVSPPPPPLPVLGRLTAVAACMS